MIESGTLARFTPNEVEEFRQIGLDLSKVRHQDDIERQVSRWANTLAGERFDLLEKIASEMAKAKKPLTSRPASASMAEAPSDLLPGKPQSPTQYVATLRCQTWNVWPELTVIESEFFALDLGEGKPVFAQAAVLSYLNRSRHWEYTNERTERGPLIPIGIVPGLYLVRDAILKAPEDEIPVAVEHANARRGEIDISFAFMFGGELPSSARDSIRSAAFAFMSLINLKLGDFLTPVAPLAIRKIMASGGEFESTVFLAVESRKFFSKKYVEPAIAGIARSLSVGPNAKKLRTALELYGSHFHERQARTRFLLLVIALEALASPTPRPPIALYLVTKWQEELTAARAQYANSSAEWAALDALGRELLYRRDDSIRSQIRALAQRAVEPKNPDAEQFSRRAVAVYDKRSTLVHDGFLPAEELASVEAEAREVLEIILRAFTADKP